MISYSKSRVLYNNQCETSHVTIYGDHMVSQHVSAVFGRSVLEKEGRNRISVLNVRERGREMRFQLQCN